MEALSSIGAIVLVFTLLGGLVWVSKKQGTWTLRTMPGRRIVVEEQVRIHPQWSICVLTIDGEIYYVGVSPAALHVLHRGPKQ